jgi:hypothetical protein
MKSSLPLSEEIQVTFRFVGDHVDPKVITSTIELQPSLAHVKGEIPEKHPEHRYPTGFWGIDSSIPSNHALEEHLEILLDILEPKALVIKELADAGLVPDFFCGCFTSRATTSFKINAETLRRIANIGASLEYHLYWDDEDEVVDI